MPRKFIKSVRYAKSGAAHAIKTQRNLWIHFFIGVAVLIFALWLKVSSIELAVLILTIFGILALEMINTSIEEMVNILSPSQRKEAALAKNIAAAAVLLAAVGAILIGAIIFVPRLLGL